MRSNGVLIMDLNRKIIIIFAVLTFVSCIAVIKKSVSVNTDKREIAAETTVNVPQKVQSDEEYVALRLEELKTKVNRQETYNFYLERCTDIPYYTDEISAQCETLRQKTEQILINSEKCMERIASIENSEDTYIQKRAEVDAFENEEDYNNLQTALYECDVEKSRLDFLIKTYKKMVPVEAEKTDALEFNDCSYRGYSVELLENNIQGGAEPENRIIAELPHTILTEHFAEVVSPAQSI